MHRDVPNQCLNEIANLQQQVDELRDVVRVLADAIGQASQATCLCRQESAREHARRRWRGDRSACC